MNKSNSFLSFIETLNEVEVYSHKANNLDDKDEVIKNPHYIIKNPDISLVSSKSDTFYLIDNENNKLMSLVAKKFPFSKFVKGLNNAIEISGITTTPKGKGRGLSMLLFDMLVSKGYTIISSEYQSIYAKEMWRKLSKKYKLRVLDFDEFKIIPFVNFEDCYSNDNSKANLRLILN